MFEELIGKTVTVNMVAASSGNETMVPCSYFGKAISVKDNFLKIYVNKSFLTFDTTRQVFGGFGSKIASIATTPEQVEKVMYFNVNHISYIKVEE